MAVGDSDKYESLSGSALVTALAAAATGCRVRLPARSGLIFEELSEQPDLRV